MWVHCYVISRRIWVCPSLPTLRRAFQPPWWLRTFINQMKVTWKAVAIRFVIPPTSSPYLPLRRHFTENRLVNTIVSSVYMKYYVNSRLWVFTSLPTRWDRLGSNQQQMDSCSYPFNLQKLYHFNYCPKAEVW